MDWDNPRLRLGAFKADPWVRGDVLEKLLLYDRLVIPTVDFSILPPLIHWLTPKVFKDMLGDGAVDFVRYKGGLGYAGGGAGLIMFEIHPPEGEKELWWHRATYADMEEAAYIQLKERLQGVDERALKLFAKLTAVSTIETKLAEFQQKVAHETYMDVLGSPLLRSYFGIRNTNMTNLTGLTANQVRVFSSIAKPAVAGDEIDICLRLAALNLEAYLAAEAGAQDMVTDLRFTVLLDAKVERFNEGRKSTTAFSELLKIEAMPDVVPFLVSNEVSIDSIWMLRNSRGGIRFREWFQTHGPHDPAMLVQEYVKALKQPKLVDRLPLKIIRYVVTNVAGLVPVLGAATSFVDSFLLDKILKGANPRYFIDDLRHRLFLG